MIQQSEIPKYKKKKNQKSKSSKRSDHKHQYKKIIIRSFIGWQWAKKCEICGRIQFDFTLADKEFRRPETLKLPYVSKQHYYTYEEILERYPDIEVINEDPWESV